MNQPDIGLKVTELRKEKGITQEQLAEYCEVSTRTIQRIESGEVEPRAFTRNSLSNTLGFDFGKDNSQNESLWLALLHLSCVVSNIIFPLLIWSWKKNQSYKIDQHGRKVLNFQITLTLVLFVLVLCMVVVFPGTLILMREGTLGEESLGIASMLALFSVFPFILIGVFTTYQGVINTIRALSDKEPHYPLSIPFVR